MKNLVIVESPAKAKTIEKILGNEFVVKSSYGHIRDLPTKGLSIDKANGFEPTYEIPDDKIKVVSDLQKAADKAEIIWLASDEDREGEAIAWHLGVALRLDFDSTRRIVFHEITAPAIKAAIDKPRKIDIGLVNAQQARRVLDRLVGYELSPVLWKKVQSGLSAGRVQSVAVRIIVDREREIQAFEPSSNFRVIAQLEKDGVAFEAELNRRPDSAPDARAYLEYLLDGPLTVVSVTQKPSERSPSAPFTTSTLQQEASRRLGFGVKQTMTLAQRLYENGHITYMRTDSTNLSGIAITAAKEYISSTYGSQYSQVRQYKTKNSSAQEAHEAIRPTNIISLEAGNDEAQRKLYQLIWKRAVASQMASAKTLRTEIELQTSGQQAIFVAKGEVLQFDGFLKVYGGGKDDAILPLLEKGDQPDLREAHAHETFSRPPARYSEASLVKALEELGIGRPSTYAPTISTIQARGYVEKGDLEGSERQARHLELSDNTIRESAASERYGADRNKLMPTHLAEVTTDFLVKYFAPIVDTGFTARAEKQLDEIAEGTLLWSKAISDFYTNFHPLIEKAGEASRQEASQSRLLGTDPKSGKPIYARFGRFGPMLQRGDADDDKSKKPDFAPLPTGVRMEQVTLDQALTMFELPRVVGQTADGHDIKANIGRFGPYIQVEKTFISIKPLDPFTITLDEARKLYAEKMQVLANREIKVFTREKIQVLNGQYGPYVTDGSKNARIPKSIEPKDITIEQATELLEKAKPAKKRPMRRTRTK